MNGRGPGTTRDCPHCGAVILASLAVCPQCRHHLRFDSEAAGRQQVGAEVFRFEGRFRQPRETKGAEYQLVIALRNGEGHEVARRVIGVGALRPDEECAFALSLETFTLPG
ncbi:MAG: hypothetical protein KatS3mg125_1735 [Lysobacterales bacterium]|nr:MAG: hypothetical protein KatS3mg125_1735 [Xanthomonadales bacterium]